MASEAGYRLETKLPEDFDQALIKVCCCGHFVD